MQTPKPVVLRWACVIAAGRSMAQVVETWKALALRLASAEVAHKPAETPMK